jgi:hypothetical protein
VRGLRPKQERVCVRPWLGDFLAKATQPVTYRVELDQLAATTSGTLALLQLSWLVPLLFRAME